MWLDENGAFQKLCRHDDACFSAKTSTPLSKYELNKKRATNPGGGYSLYSNDRDDRRIF